MSPRPSLFVSPTTTELDGCWRQEWRGNYGGKPYEVVLQRVTETSTWRWTLDVSGRRTALGGAPDFAAALSAARAACHRHLEGGSR